MVDAFQGVEAQTVANAYSAMDHDLKIIPVINKIDLNHARVDEVTQEMNQVLGIDPDEIVRCSGKAGIELTNSYRRSSTGSHHPPAKRLVIFKRWSSTLTMTTIVGRSRMCV